MMRNKIQNSMTSGVRAFEAARGELHHPTLPRVDFVYGTDLEFHTYIKSVTAARPIAGPSSIPLIRNASTQSIRTPPRRSIYPTLTTPLPPLGSFRYYATEAGRFSRAKPHFKSVRSIIFLFRHNTDSIISIGTIGVNPDYPRQTHMLMAISARRSWKDNPHGSYHQVIIRARRWQVYGL